MKELDIGLTKERSDIDLLLSLDDLDFPKVQWQRFLQQLSFERNLIAEREPYRFTWTGRKVSCSVSNQAFFQFMQEYKGRLVFRTIAVNTWTDRRKKDYVQQEYSEVFRMIEGSYYAIEKNTYLKWMYGKELVYVCSRYRYKYYGCYGTWNQDRYDYITANVGLSDHNFLYTLDELIEKRPELKYSMIGLNNNPVYYLAYYKKYPVVEFLKKCKFKNLYGSKNCLNRLAKDKSFMKFLFQCYKMKVTDEGYNFYCSYYKRYKFDMSQIEVYKWAYTEFSVARANLALDAREKNSGYTYYRFEPNPVFKSMNKIEHFIELKKYLDSKNVEFAYYKDYIQMAAALDHDITDPYWRFPNDVVKMHNRCMQEKKNVAETASKLKMDMLHEVVLDLMKFNAKIDGYDIFITDNLDIIKKQCDVLYQCLLRNNYITKVMMQEEILVFIWKDDKPVATAEVFYNKKVGQFYGDERDRNNCKPSKEVERAFNKWLETFKPVKRTYEIKKKFYKGFTKVLDNIYYGYNDFKFTVGGVYETPFDDDVIIDYGRKCRSTTKVFHFCDSITEISNHYNPKVYCEIKPLGPVIDDNGALLSNRIKIVKALSEEEVKKIILKETATRSIRI